MLIRWTLRSISLAVSFWSKGEAKAMSLRHEGYLGGVGAFMSYEKRGLDELLAHQLVERFPVGAPYVGGSIHGPPLGDLTGYGPMSSATGLMSAYGLSNETGSGPNSSFHAGSGMGQSSSRRAKGHQPYAGQHQDEGTPMRRAKGHQQFAGQHQYEGTTM